MDVHLVAVKVRVEGVADALVEAQRAARHDHRAQRHERDAVQRRLAVEEDDVAVVAVALHDVANLDASRGAAQRLVAMIMTMVMVMVMVMVVNFNVVTVF